MIIKTIMSLLIFCVFLGCNQIEKPKTTVSSTIIQKQEPTHEEISTEWGTIEKLKELKKLKKFGPEPQSKKFPLGYVGLLPETNQPQANQLLNQSIQELIDLIEKNPSPDKKEILELFELGLNSLKDIAIDTEDRERVCEYYSEIREIIGFKSTDGLLNNWLY